MSPFLSEWTLGAHAGAYTLLALPLRLGEGSEAAPARVVLLEPGELGT